MIEQPTTAIEQPQLDRPARRSAPSTPQLLALREEPATPTRRATPTFPLLAGLLVIAVFVATSLLAAMVVGRVLGKRVRA